jgi:hypothetical protein
MRMTLTLVLLWNICIYCMLFLHWARYNSRAVNCKQILWLPFVVFVFLTRLSLELLYYSDNTKKQSVTRRVYDPVFCTCASYICNILCLSLHSLQTWLMRRRWFKRMASIFLPYFWLSRQYNSNFPKYTPYGKFLEAYFNFFSQEGGG